jgi:Zn-dependent peptidase ImmA (M78 family)
MSIGGDRKERKSGASPTKSRIFIDRRILEWAMARSGRSIPDFHRTLPKLSLWLGGEYLTLHEVESLAKETSTPLGYFFLSEPPQDKLPIPHFRTIKNGITDSSPSPDLIETIQMMEQRQDWMSEYLFQEGHSRLSFVRSANVNTSPEEIANNIRQTLNLEELWAADQPSWNKALIELRARMEDAGILVVVTGMVGTNTHRRLEVSEFRGFVLIDDYAPLVFVNNTDGKAAQMFTLAHELAHIWFGKSAIFDLIGLQPADDEIERVCNRVAAEFLVPERILRQFWQQSVRRMPESERYHEIAQHFKVSELVAAYRLLNLGLIRSKDFYDFYTDYDQDRRNLPKSDGGNFYDTQRIAIGRRFAEAVIIAAREGRLLYRDAYRLTGLHGNTFEVFARKLGMI